MKLWILVKTEDNVKARRHFIIGGPFIFKKYYIDMECYNYCAGGYIFIDFFFFEGGYIVINIYAI